MFVDKADLYAKILEEELEEITRGDDTLITQACLAAESEARGYLYDSFDVDTIFSAAGLARHQLLLDLVADIALYILVARVQAGQNMDDRQDRYDRAISWMKAVSKTKDYADLPRRQNTVQTHITYGSNPKRNNYY